MESDNELVARLNRIKKRTSEYDDSLRSVIKQIATLRQYTANPATVHDGDDHSDKDQSALLEYANKWRAKLHAIKQNGSYAQGKGLVEALSKDLAEYLEEIGLIESRYGSINELQTVKAAVQVVEAAADKLKTDFASIQEPLADLNGVEGQPQKTVEDFNKVSESQGVIMQDHDDFANKLAATIEDIGRVVNELEPQVPKNDDDHELEENTQYQARKALRDFRNKLEQNRGELNTLERPNRAQEPEPFQEQPRVDAPQPLIGVMNELKDMESKQTEHKTVSGKVYDGIKESLDAGNKSRDDIEDELEKVEKAQERYEEDVKGTLNLIQERLNGVLDQQEKGSKARRQTKKIIQGVAELLRGTRKKRSGRTLILCFDGTGNKFGTNSNVVRFFDALTKDEPDSQLCYYMPGIGTYNKRQFLFSTTAALSLKIDSAIARGLNDRVKEGYIFLMQNYRKGDKICLFGFSRGAYTARALSGMVYKVGLLPPHNLQQVDFAFTMYNSSDKEGARLARKFKQTFATDVPIDFLGVWDTVSSVGIIPRSLPHSTYNDGVKVFRHALALDEKRARFRPSVWGEPVGAKEELDEEPRVTPRDPTEHPDDWVYDPPDVPDVKEVWFAGCHADVGGGSHRDEVIQSLSNITLRWMIKECYQQRENGLVIMFKNNTLRSFGLDPVQLEKDPDLVKIRGGLQAPDTQQLGDPVPNAPKPTATDITLKILKMWVSDQADVTNGDVYDQLVLAWAWWILEFLPMMYTKQQPDGTWLRQRRRNMGRGRYIPHSDHRVHVHISVKDRINDLKYRPQALNWSDIYDNKLIEWES